MNELLKITKFENAINMFLFFSSFLFLLFSLFPSSVMIASALHYNFKYLCILYDSDIRPCLNRYIYTPYLM